MDERRRPEEAPRERVDEDLEHTEVRQIEDHGPDHPGPDQGGRFPVPSSDQDQGRPAEPSQPSRGPGPRRKERRR